MDRTEPYLTIESKPTPLIVAVDDGYARVKVCTPRSLGNAHEPPRVLEYGTSVTSRPNALSNLDGSVTSTWVADGQQFTVADTIKGDNTATDDFHWSPMNRVLVNNFLCEAGLSDVEIDVLVVGLPMAQFFTPNGKVSDNIQRKVNSLKQPVQPVGKTLPPARIKEVIVRPQGMSALFDYMTDWDLQLVNTMPKRVVMIDIGGRTTDLAYIIDGKQNQTSNSGSLQLGVLDVQQMLSAEITKEFNLKSTLPPDILDTALRQKKFNFRGAEQNVGQIVARCVNSFAQRIKREIAAQLGDTDIADKIILVGGGAVVFEAAMRDEYPGAFVPENPSWANVRGFWKYAAANARSRK